MMIRHGALHRALFVLVLGLLVARETAAQPMQDFAVAQPAAEADEERVSSAADSAPPVAAVESRWRELYARVSPSIVLIRRGNAEGTGFLFGSQRHIATALHVVSHVGTVWVVTKDGKPREGKVVAWDEEWDIAIIEIEQPIAAPVLHAVGKDQGQVGDMVAAIGNPWGAEQRKRKGSEAPVWALSQGVISAPPGDFVQTDAPVNPGNSGGPLLTRDAEVVGVVVVRIADADGISFATSASHLQALYGRIGQQGEYSPDVDRWQWQLSWVPVAERQLAGVLLGGRWAMTELLGITVRGARLWGDTEVVSSFELTQRDRWMVEAEMSARFGSDEGGLLLGVGIASSWDEITDSTAVISGASISEQRDTRSASTRRMVVSAGLFGSPVLVDTGVYFFGGEPITARLGLGLLF